jgi:hypothetical protein
MRKISSHAMKRSAIYTGDYGYSRLPSNDFLLPIIYLAQHSMLILSITNGICLFGYIGNSNLALSISIMFSIVPL